MPNSFSRRTGTRSDSFGQDVRRTIDPFPDHDSGDNSSSSSDNDPSDSKEVREDYVVADISVSNPHAATSESSLDPDECRLSPVLEESSSLGLGLRDADSTIIFERQSQIKELGLSELASHVPKKSLKDVEVRLESFDSNQRSNQFTLGDLFEDFNQDPRKITDTNIISEKVHPRSRRRLDMGPEVHHTPSNSVQPKQLSPKKNNCCIIS